MTDTSLLYQSVVLQWDQNPPHVSRGVYEGGRFICSGSIPKPTTLSVSKRVTFPMAFIFSPLLEDEGGQFSFRPPYPEDCD